MSGHEWDLYEVVYVATRMLHLVTGFVCPREAPGDGNAERSGGGVFGKGVTRLFTYDGLNLCTYYIHMYLYEVTFCRSGLVAVKMTLMPSRAGIYRKMEFHINGSALFGTETKSRSA